MYQDELLAKIEEAGLVGRGGAAFPVHLKWQRIKSLKNPKKYVVCNASEGEIGVEKDLYILKNYPEEVIRGLLLAMDFLGTKEAYINFNKDYYQATRNKIDPLLDLCRKKGYLVSIFQEEPSYIGGETGALLNAIEGKKTQPRPESPSPSLKGIFGYPVLLHNVETLYDVARVSMGNFKPTRFSTILGVKNEGVYQVGIKQKVANILRETKNYPEFPFFVQVGGGASGEILTSDQAEQAVVGGCGSIEIYKTSPSSKQFLDKIFNFYAKESCGKCTPCRDGSWQLQQMLAEIEEGSEITWQKIAPIIKVMEKSSYCGLGKSIALPVKSYAKNILGIEI